MIDIHSHILWGLDDGSPTLEVSLAMLAIAAEPGTTDIVATPHSNFRYLYDPEVNATRRDQLVAAGAKPRIHLGCDFHLSAVNIQSALENPERFTVNQGSYLMVELPEMFNPMAMDEVFRQLMNRGIHSVVTHPERNPVLQKSPEILARWVRQGCFSQLTAMSLTGGFGPIAKQIAWHFLRGGQAHFVASDAHDTEYRTPRLDAARALVSDEIDTDFATLLFVGNPASVIHDYPLSPDLQPVAQSRPWYHFW